MKGYILGIAGIVLIAAVVSAIVPEGKMGRFIKGMTKLLVFAVVATPFVTRLNEGSFPFSGAEIGEDEAYLEQCAALAAERSAKEIEAYLAEEFALDAHVVTEHDRENFSLTKIRAELNDPGIFEQDEHIHMTARVKSALEDRYQCVSEVIWTDDG